MIASRWASDSSKRPILSCSSNGLFFGQLVVEAPRHAQLLPQEAFAAMGSQGVEKEIVVGAGVGRRAVGR